MVVLRRIRPTLLLLLSTAAGCDWSGSSASGLGSLLRFENAQAMGGSISDPANTIPATVAPSTRWNTLFPGVTGKILTGVVAPNANAAAIGVAGDQGYWLVPALTPDHEDPEAFHFETRFSVSPDVSRSPLLEVDPATNKPSLPISFRAVDEQGRFGPATILSMTVEAGDPTGALVVSLVWDSPVDLDLHVLVPADNAEGFVEVWSKKPAADPAAKDGLLDFDSNAACTIDNRDRENVIWTGSPPAGRYTVRVEAFSLCGQTFAEWRAFAYCDSAIGPASIGEASGTLTDAATRAAHGAGAGITAFQFDYP